MRTLYAFLCYKRNFLDSFWTASSTIPMRLWINQMVETCIFHILSKIVQSNFEKNHALQFARYYLLCLFREIFVKVHTQLLFKVDFPQWLLQIKVDKLDFYICVFFSVILLPEKTLNIYKKILNFNLEEGVYTSVIRDIKNEINTVHLIEIWFLPNLKLN